MIDPATEPPWENIDAGIRPIVRLLHDQGFAMYASCDGGEGHSFRFPTVIVWSERNMEMTADRLIGVLIDAGVTGFEVSRRTSHQDRKTHWTGDGANGPPSIILELWSLESVPGSLGDGR